MAAHKPKIMENSCNMLLDLVHNSTHYAQNYASIIYASLNATCCRICCCSLLMVSSALVSSASSSSAVVCISPSLSHWFEAVAVTPVYQRKGEPWIECTQPTYTEWCCGEAVADQGGVSRFPLNPPFAATVYIAHISRTRMADLLSISCAYASLHTSRRMIALAFTNTYIAPTQRLAIFTTLYSITEGDRG